MVIRASAEEARSRRRLQRLRAWKSTLLQGRLYFGLARCCNGVGVPDVESAAQATATSLLGRRQISPHWVQAAGRGAVSGCGFSSRLPHWAPWKTSRARRAWISLGIGFHWATVHLARPGIPTTLQCHSPALFLLAPLVPASTAFAHRQTIINGHPAVGGGCTRCPVAICTGSTGLSKWMAPTCDVPRPAP